MKKILCFGDSNTFGYNPKDGSRFDYNVRWSGILKQALKESNYEIIEKGCNNRTCFVKNITKELTGYEILPQYLEKDLFCVILAIGINDIQKIFNSSLDEVEKGLKNLIKIIKDENKKIKILILSPSILSKDVLNGCFSFQFDEISIEKSKHFAKIYKKIADENNCDFIDLNTVAAVSCEDGLHYSKDSHGKIAQKLIEYFKNNNF